MKVDQRFRSPLFPAGPGFRVEPGPPIRLHTSWATLNCGNGPTTSKIRARPVLLLHIFWQKLTFFWRKEDAAKSVIVRDENEFRAPLSWDHPLKEVRLGQNQNPHQNCEG